MPFGRTLGTTGKPAKSTAVEKGYFGNGILSLPGGKTKAKGQKRGRDFPMQTFVKRARFDVAGDIVGGDTFRGENQHEGLPTAIAEAYADGLAGNALAPSTAPWDVLTRRAHDAGQLAGNKYNPLVKADAVRVLTGRTVLVSPPGTDSAGTALKVAGFHPSPISDNTSESSQAHIKLAEAQVKVLEARAAGRLSSDEAADIGIAAVHLASLAPGPFADEAAFKIKPGKGTVVGGKLLPTDPKTYETRRENLKTAVATEAVFLTKNDRVEINTIVGDYLKDVAHPPAKPILVRRLETFVSGDTNPALTSPRRSATPILPTAPPQLQKGDYDGSTIAMPPASNSNAIAEASVPLFILE